MSLYILKQSPFAVFSFSLSASPPKDYQAPGSNRKPPFQWVEGRKRECVSPQQGRPPSPQQKDQQSWAAADRPALRGCSSPSPRSRRRSNRSRHSSSSDIGTPDVIIEGVLDEGEKHGEIKKNLIYMMPFLIRTLNCTCRMETRREALISFFVNLFVSPPCSAPTHWPRAGQRQMQEPQEKEKSVFWQQEKCQLYDFYS